MFIAAHARAMLVGRCNNKQCALNVRLRVGSCNQSTTLRSSRVPGRGLGRALRPVRRQLDSGLERVYLWSSWSNISCARSLRSGLCPGTSYPRVRYSLAHYKTLVPAATTPFPFCVEPRNLVEPLPSRCSIYPHSFNGLLNIFGGCKRLPPTPSLPQLKDA